TSTSSLANHMHNLALHDALPISASYTTPAMTSSDNGAKFVVVVSNSAGSVTSNAATLTVNAAATAPTITTQPANQTVTVGQRAEIGVETTGLESPCYLG